MKSVRTAAVALALISLSFAAHTSQSSVIFVPEVESIYDVTYARFADSQLQLDIAWPREGGPYPVLVYFHGGGWGIGDKIMFRHRMEMIAQSGYVVFNANYRLSTDARFPAAVNDAMGAVIFAKDKAPDYNGDPDRVAVMGDSAGAHLAAMVAMAWDDPYFDPSYSGSNGHDARVQAGVLMYGLYRLDWLVKQDPRIWGVVVTRPMVLAFMGGTPRTKPKAYEKASLSHYLDKDNIPPLLIMCGTADSLFVESEWLHKELDKREVRHTAFFVSGAEHEFNYMENREDFPYLHAIMTFLDKELSGKKVMP